MDLMYADVAKALRISAELGRVAARVTATLRDKVTTEPEAVEDYLRGAWHNHIQDFAAILLNGRDAETTRSALVGTIVLNAYFKHAGHWDKMIRYINEKADRLEKETR